VESWFEGGKSCRYCKAEGALIMERGTREKGQRESESTCRELHKRNSFLKTIDWERERG